MIGKEDEGSREDSDRILINFQAEDGIRDGFVSRGLGDVYKRQPNSKLQAENMFCFAASFGDSGSH